MTSAAATFVPGVAVGQPPRNLDVRPRRLLVPLAVVLPPAGAILILLSFHGAASRATPDQTQFALFWAGFLGGMLPLVALVCAGRMDGVTRTCALVGIGLFGMVPRLLHFRPTGSDEFIHLRQAMEAFIDGDVGHTLYLLPISKEFFGLHQTTSAFARLTGLPLWYAGLTVILLAHVLSVVAVYQLVRMVGAPSRGAAVGAVVYTLNPSWLSFDVSFSYESLALPLLLWCLAAAVAAGRALQKPALRSIAVAVLCVAVLPMVHHLTTIMLCLILALLILARVVLFVRRTAAGGLGAQREPLWPLLLIAFCLLASIIYWWSEKYDWLLAYLGPALTQGFAQLGKILDGVGRSSGQRSLFGDAQNPIYEIVSGYLFPFLVLTLFLWSLAVLWRNRRRVGSAPWAFAVLGAMFFASMPLVLTRGGAEGAHRSWAFSFIGIAVLCGMAWSFRPRHHDGRSHPVARVFGRPSVRAAVSGMVFTVMAVGSMALGVNLSQRFPGTANVGDDARSVSEEGRAVAEWMAAHTPVDSPVLADRYVSQQVGSLGRMSALRPSPTFPIWDLYMSAPPVRPEVLKQIFDSKIRYFVVDARMATTRPRVGYWFTRDEPGVGGKDLFPQSALDRFNCLPWLRGVYAAGPLTVYEVNADILHRTAAGSCDWRTE